VAESAGQRESTGNVSRELGRGCNRRERVSEEVAAAEGAAGWEGGRRRREVGREGGRGANTCARIRAENSV
jgi:hypothetical protein